VFNEKALYNKQDPNWQAYERYRGWQRSKFKNTKRFEKNPQQ